MMTAHAIKPPRVPKSFTVWRLGAAADAYLTLPWLIASGITVVMWNVSSSFVVEAAGSHGHPGAVRDIRRAEFARV